MKERAVTICNKAGIHCRPSSVILNTILQKYPLHTFVVTNSSGEEAEVNSILNLITLGLICGDKVKLQVSGPDEEKAIAEIGDLFENEFDFPPRTN